MSNIPTSRFDARSSEDWTRLAGPLDALRSALLRALGPYGRRLLSDRALRVAFYGVSGVCFSLVVTCLAPVWVFALGPILLGVPHLVADVRYLVVAPGLTKRHGLVLATLVPLVASAVTASTAVGLAAGFGAIAFARASRAARALFALGWGAIVLAAAQHPRTATWIVVHGHNVLAVIVFLLVFARPRRRTIAALPTVVFAIVSLAFVTGTFDNCLFRPAALQGGPSTGLSTAGIVDSLVPLGEPVMALRLAFLFIFAQSVHYVFWLRLVPEQARERAGLRSFGSSLRALRGDLGTSLFVGSLLAAVTLLGIAAWSLEGARLIYLRLAGPHAFLEIAFLLLWLLERDSLRVVPNEG